MTAVPSSEQITQLEEVTTRNPVSEALMQKFGGVLNFFLSWIHVEVRFNMNGPYRTFAGKEGIDGVFRFPRKAKIIAIEVTNREAGTAGDTEIDLKTTSNPQGVWATIFSTKPKINFTALSWAFANLSTNASGTTKPVLITTPFNVNAGDYLRMDNISVMDGSPKDFSVSVVYSPRV